MKKKLTYLASVYNWLEVFTAVLYSDKRATSLLIAHRIVVVITESCVSLGQLQERLLSIVCCVCLASGQDTTGIQGLYYHLDHEPVRLNSKQRAFFLSNIKF